VIGRKASICLSTKCTWVFCTSCTEAERQRHRHYLYKVEIRRPTGQDFSMRKCDSCAQGTYHPHHYTFGRLTLALTVYMAGFFQGLWCGTCNNFDVCLDCYVKVSGGKKELPKGLPHKLRFSNCAANNWIFYKVA
jgi:hypothetical protein